MTVSIVSQKIVPRVLSSACEELTEGSPVLIDSHINYLEDLIQKLTNQRDSLVDQRYRIVQAHQDVLMSKAAVGKIPMQALTSFLHGADLGRLSLVSRHFQSQCAPGGKYLLAHMSTPRGSSEVELLQMFRGLNCGALESLEIDLKKPLGKKLMNLISLYGNQCHNLRSLKINASAENGGFITDLFAFMGGLPANQLRSIHLSGFRSLETVGHILSRQSQSIVKFQVDYYVNGHERDMEPAYLPVMPNLEALVYDVADVTDVPATLLIERLSAIRNKSAFKALYLPHMQISGSASEIASLVSMIQTDFTALEQLVIRFRKLPLSVGDIIRLRESFSSLPAVCISDHFVVCQSSWCSWWPRLCEVWSGPEKITGLSVFREQIDFESLGTTANREWLKLTTEQKEYWSTKIVKRVAELYNATTTMTT